MTNKQVTRKDKLLTKPKQTCDNNKQVKGSHEQPHEVMRGSTRKTSKPHYLKDYVVPKQKEEKNSKFSCMVNVLKIETFKVQSKYHK